MLKTRAFVGAFGRTAGSPPRLCLDGHDFSVFGGDGAWILYVPEAKAKSPHTTLSPAAATAMLAVSGRPFSAGVLGVTAPSPKDLANTDGKFSLAWMSARHCLLATDSLGSGGLFYRTIDDTIFFADHLGLLLQVVRGPITPNKLGIASLCVGQLQLTPETHVSGIYRLGSGHCISARRGAPDWRLELDTSCYLALPDALTSAPPIKTIEAFDEALRSSIEREHYGPATALMLSGGRDSRALALAGHDQGFEAVTYGSALSTDMMWAKRFARRARLKHHAVPYESWSLQTYADVIVGLDGGTQGLQIANNLIGYDWAREYFDLAVVGYMGDAPGSHLGHIAEIPDRLFFDLLIGRQTPRDCDLSVIFAPEISTMRGIILDRIRELRDLPRYQINRILDITIRQATWISGMFSACSWYMPMSSPLFFRPLLAGLFQADFELLAGQAMYDRWAEFKLRQLGIRFRKTQWPAKFMSLRTRLTKGMWPPTRVYWPEVYARSRDWLEKLPDTGIDYLDRITRESMQSMRPDSNADDPVLCMSIPVQQAFNRWGRN